MKKKMYTKPGIITEEILEQTSLACNITDPFNPDGGMFNEASSCVGEDISKNGNFSGLFNCDVQLLDTETTCYPLVAGQLLS